MKYWNRLLPSFQCMSITAKFGFGITVFLTLIVLIGVTNYVALQFVGEAEKSIRTSTEIQRLLLEMDRGLEKARRLHGDFFLHYREIGLVKAHEQYAQPSVRESAKVVKNSHILKNMIAVSEVSNALSHIQVDLNLFLSYAKRFADTSIKSVELVTQLVAPKRGLQSVLENHFILLRGEIERDSKITRLYDEMRFFVQEYEIVKKRYLMQSAFNVAFKLRHAISTSFALTKSQKKTAVLQLDHCIDTAENILKVDVAIKAKFNDFSLQAKAVAPVAEALVTVAKNEVQKAREKINQTEKLATILIFLIAIIGLIVATIIARVLNRTITRRVVKLTQFASELKRGNLNVFAEDKGRDELGELAETFNLMSGRIRDLVDHLEQKVMQRTAELADSEKRFRELFEHSSSGVAIFKSLMEGTNFFFRDVNQAVVNMEGKKREEFLGKNLTDMVPEENGFALTKIFREVWRTGTSVRYPVETYSKGHLLSYREYMIYKLSSGELVAVFDDRTAQKQAEKETKAMGERLENAKKMEDIGLLAGGVAHDLNNILAGIIGFPEMLLLKIPAGSELRKPITMIQKAGERAVLVVADLLTVARGVATAKKLTDLNKLVTEYLHTPEMMKIWNENKEVNHVTELDSKLPGIECSPIHIKKCLMNLVINAMEAIKDSGTIRIVTFHQQVDEITAKKNALQAGKYTVLQVTDNGSGIPEGHLEHIFEPFYTKKIMGKSGTGLGLTVVWNSVKEHGGTVIVESNKQGTSFFLYFPASKSIVALEQKKNGMEEIQSNGEHILIVDDEEQLREIAGLMLTKLGYQVSSVNSGEEALDYLRQKRVDLVLLDMLMEPGINGRQTYEQIIEIYPKQKAVITSGFSESKEVKIAQQLGAYGFLAKPYTMEKLGAIMKEAINDKREM